MPSASAPKPPAPTPSPPRPAPWPIRSISPPSSATRLPARRACARPANAPSSPSSHSRRSRPRGASSRSSGGSIACSPTTPAISTTWSPRLAGLPIRRVSRCRASGSSSRPACRSERQARPTCFASPSSATIPTSRPGAPSEVAGADFFFEKPHRLPGIVEKRIDREGLAIVFERLRLLAERLIGEAKLFERAIMFWVAFERAIEIGKGKVVFGLGVLDFRAEIPGFGFFGRHGDRRVENLKREIEILVLGEPLCPADEEIDRGAAGHAPQRLDIIDDRRRLLRVLRLGEPHIKFVEDFGFFCGAGQRNIVGLDREPFPFILPG